MRTDKLGDLEQIMNDNATFIRVPCIGSSTNTITIYGDSETNIQRTIRSVMRLVSRFLYKDA